MPASSVMVAASACLRCWHEAARKVWRTLGRLVAPGARPLVAVPVALVVVVVPVRVGVVVAPATMALLLARPPSARAHQRHLRVELLSCAGRPRSARTRALVVVVARWRMAA